MRVVINLFLVLFVADSLISVVDELLLFFAGSSNISGVRNLFASSVILLSLPVYLLLGIDKRLPRRVLLPMLFFVVWSLLATWLFPSLGDSRIYDVLSVIAQLLLCVLPVEYVRRVGGKGLLLPVSIFEAPFFNIRQTLLFAAANLIIIPAVLVLCTLATLNAYADKATSGFIRIAPDGLYMSERIYTRDHKTIRLNSMIHVGDKQFYDELVGSLSDGRTIILAEGVTDEKHLLKNKFGYGKMAGFLGLSSQEKMRFKGRLIESLDDGNDGVEKSKSGDSDIMRADVDVSNLSQTTINFLNTIGKYINESTSFGNTIMAINGWAEKELTPEMQLIIMDDILHKRSKELIGHLDMALARYDTIIVPWGALHMSEIEESVLKRGFVLQKKRSRVSINFLNMLLAQR